VITAAAQLLLQGIAGLRGQMVRHVKLAQRGDVMIANGGHRSVLMVLRSQIRLPVRAVKRKALALACKRFITVAN
jgi:hypothetical protein